MQAEWGVGLIYPWSGPTKHDSLLFSPFFKMHNEISIMHERATPCSACSLQQSTLLYRTALAISKHQHRTQCGSILAFHQNLNILK